MLRKPGLPTERVLNGWRGADVAKEVRAFDTRLLAEPRSVRLDHVMHRRGAKWAPGQQFAIGVGHQVVRAQSLGHALAQILKVVLLGCETRRVDHAQVVRRIPVDHPRSERLPDSATKGHAGGVHPRADPNTRDVRSRSEHEIRVGRKRLRTIDESLEADLFKNRQAM